MYSSVSVDGFVADANDQPGPLFDWLSSGDVSSDESGFVKVSQTSYVYTRASLTDQAPLSGRSSHQVLSRAQAMVWAIPSSRVVVGLQPRSVRALVLSGMRRFRSS